MAVMKRRALITIFALVALLAPHAAHALPFPQDSYALWMKELEREAIESGISSATVQDALAHALPDPRVVELDRKQPETTVTFAAYSARIVSPERVREGRRLRQEHALLLDQVARRYGVPAEVIVALWGVESSYGRNSGDYDVIDSLVTLAYEGRRAELFRKQLLAALRVLDQEHMPPEALRGSWAGAMGQCQFMPSTYLRYAVDNAGDGRRDIWNDLADIFASIANYLAAEGWRPLAGTDSLGWGRGVAVRENAQLPEIGLDHPRTVAEWGKLGIRAEDGRPLPAEEGQLQAALIQPDGPDGRSFLVYDNFRALMRWNRSTYFAASVSLLADRLK